MIICGVGRAGSGALAGVVDTREVLHANVGVLAGSVERCVDGTAQTGGSVEAKLSSRGVGSSCSRWSQRSRLGTGYGIGQH